MCCAIPIMTACAASCRGSTEPAPERSTEDDAVLVNGTPEVTPFAVVSDEHLVKVPGVARLGPMPAKLLGEVPAELHAPAADVLIGDYYAARPEAVRRLTGCRRAAALLAAIMDAQPAPGAAPNSTAA